MTYDWLKCSYQEWKALSEKGYELVPWTDEPIRRVHLRAANSVGEPTIPLETAIAYAIIHSGAEPQSALSVLKCICNRLHECAVHDDHEWVGPPDFWAESMFVFLQHIHAALAIMMDMPELEGAYERPDGDGHDVTAPAQVSAKVEGEEGARHD
jgi:hypothetical protein